MWLLACGDKIRYDLLMNLGRVKILRMFADDEIEDVGWMVFSGGCCQMCQRGQKVTLAKIEHGCSHVNKLKSKFPAKGE